MALVGFLGLLSVVHGTRGGEAEPPSPTGPLSLTVAQVLAGGSAESTLYAFEGDYRGVLPDPASPAASAGPPVTRSDWAFADGTGVLYVTGARPPLDPRDDVGARVRLTGYVRRTRAGQPYIEATRVEVR